MNQFERSIYQLTEKMNDKGVPVDRYACMKISALCREYIEVINNDCKRITGLNVTQVAKLLEYLRRANCDLPDLQTTTIEKALASGDVYGWIADLLKIRLQYSKAAVKKIDAILQRISPDNTVKDCFLYYGARTGRFTAYGVQFHNLKRPDKSIDPNDMIPRLCDMDYETFESMEDPLGVVASCIRGLVCAPQGYEMNVADYSNIEQRVLAWLSGCDTLLNAYHRKEDVYIQMAQQIFPDKTITKDSFERLLGKQCVLGAGYGMSEKTFFETCIKFGIRITRELSKLAINGFQTLYKEIPVFWYALYDICVEAISKPFQLFELRRLQFYCDIDFLFIILPSGRCLSYRQPTVQKRGWKRQIFTWSVNPLNGKWESRGMWIGTISENVVSGTSRDYLCEGMLAADRVGVDLRFTVHDEIASLQRCGERSSSEFERLICPPVAWAQGCPLVAEGYIAKRYKK